MTRKRQRKSNNVLRRLCRKFIGFLLLIGIPIMLFANALQLKNITVVGAIRFSQKQIEDELLTSRLDYNTLLLYLKYQYFKEINIPFIEKIDFEIIDSNSIKIYVYEKKITGCVKFLGEYLYFDKDGIVVESASTKLQDIPQITGLTFNRIILNEKLEVQKEDLFDVILDLTRLIEKYELDVDTINFNSYNEITFICGDIKVLLGKKSTYDEALSELKGILQETKDMSLTIDMREFTRDTKTIIAKPNKSIN